MTDEPSKLDISDEMIAERRGGSGKMPDDMPSWMAKSIVNIDKFSKWIGNIVCWTVRSLIITSFSGHDGARCLATNETI